MNLEIPDGLDGYRTLTMGLFTGFLGLVLFLLCLMDFPFMFVINKCIDLKNKTITKSLKIKEVKKLRIFLKFHFFH